MTSEELQKPPKSGPGGRGRSPEARSAREARILQSIPALLQEGGFGAVTIDAVAARADVSKATIYRKWANKSELVVAALSAMLPKVSVPDRGNVEDELRWLLNLRFKQFNQPGLRNLWAGLLGASVEDSAIAESLQKSFTGTDSGHRIILERGKARGEIPASLSIEALGTIIAAAMPFRLLWQRETPDDKLVETIVLCVTSVLRHCK